MKGEGRPRNKPYWIIGIFLLPVIAMTMYMLNYDYTKGNIDRSAASKYGLVGDGGPGSGSRSSQSVIPTSGAQFSFSAELSQKSYGLRPDGSMELNGEILIRNPTSQSMFMLDLPLQTQGLWAARLSPVGGALGQQITGFPLNELFVKQINSTMYSPKTEPVYTELQGGRDLRIRFFAVTPPGSVSPGRYQFVLAYMAGSYAQSQKLTVTQGDQYSVPFIFEVLAAGATPGKNGENVPPVHSPE